MPLPPYPSHFANAAMEVAVNRQLQRQQAHKASGTCADCTAKAVGRWCARHTKMHREAVARWKNRQRILNSLGRGQ